MIKVLVDERLYKFLNSLPKEEKAHVKGVIGLFRERGFSLTKIHLKKLTKNIWELRSGNMRALFGMRGESAIVVNIFKKKTNKTPKQEIHLARKRFLG